MKKVIVWGTFDLLHQGHIEFLQNASKFGKLNVIVVPDKIVKKNKKRYPIDNEETRKRKLYSLTYVNEVFIDCIEDGLQSIDIIKPDIFCFGYDQKTKWEKKVINILQIKNATVEYLSLKEYAGGIHTTDLVQNVVHEPIIFKYFNFLSILKYFRDKNSISHWFFR